MGHLIDKSALVAEIKRRKELVSDPILLGNDLMIGERNAYFNLLTFIDSLQEEPVGEDFEKIVEEIADPTIPNAIKYGMRLQRENMMKGAVNGLVFAQRTNGEVMFRSNYVKKEGFEFGDKVKMILIKEG